jgi:hypothetical protein
MNMNCLSTNGRVNILQPKTPDLFQMYDKIPVNQIATYRNPTEGLWNNTELSDMFFSSKNIRIIQNGMRAGVAKRSNGKYIISDQDEDTLKIIMRSVFLQNSKNLPNDVEGQVYQLNKIVWDYTIPQLYGEAQGYMKYLEDASTMYKPIPPPILSSNNDKELVLKPWF